MHNVALACQESKKVWKELDLCHWKDSHLWVEEPGEPMRAPGGWASPSLTPDTAHPQTHSQEHLEAETLCEASQWIQQSQIWKQVNTLIQKKINLKLSFNIYIRILQICFLCKCFLFLSENYLETVVGSVVDLNNLKICLICSQIQKRKLNLPVSAPINVQSSEDSIIILVPYILSYHSPCAGD